MHQPKNFNDADVDLDPYNPCPICGCEMEWRDCDRCDGYGELDWAQLQWEDPIWYQPGDIEICGECNGTGGWLVCPNVPHDGPEFDGLEPPAEMPLSDF